VSEYGAWTGATSWREIKRTANANGGAIREAGFEPNEFQSAYDTTALLEKFISLMRELGKFPVHAK
jgi:hypothetical protein